jgi:hypothetical protein
VATTTLAAQSAAHAEGTAGTAAGDQHDFSLILGGPLYQLLRRTHLSGDALELVQQRILFIAAITWLPLLVLSLVEGRALHGQVDIPFLYDAEAHVRFLAALPLLIVAELVVHRRMRVVVQQFIERNLVPPAATDRFNAILASALRLRNSVVAEVALIVFVYVIGVLLLWRNYMALSATPTWYSLPGPGGMELSLTGRWYAYVSLPAFQFLLVRWYYRIFIWTRFLWQVSRIHLNLIPMHPDRVGGLGFLGNVAYAFTPLATAHGAIVAGPIANRIFYLGASLPDFKGEIFLTVLFMASIVLGPFLVFAPQLAATKRTGLREYGTLAGRYVREFEAKWIRGGAPADEPFVGSGDIQSLADLGNSFDIVKGMRLVPVSRDALIQLVMATLAPIVPLALTMMSLEELLRKLLGMVF